MPDRYRWIRESAAGELAVAACITTVVGSSLREVRAALPDAGRPVDYVELATSVVVVEPNGWQGSTPEVVTAWSSGGRAASCCWNVNAMVLVALAERGQLVAWFEGSPVNAVGATPEIAAELAVDLDFDRDDRAALGLVIIERFTGQAITPAALGLSG